MFTTTAHGRSASAETFSSVAAGDCVQCGDIECSDHLSLNLRAHTAATNGHGYVGFGNLVDLDKERCHYDDEFGNLVVLVDE